jgi:hypothetical protein
MNRVVLAPRGRELGAILRSDGSSSRLSAIATVRGKAPRVALRRQARELVRVEVLAKQRCEAFIDGRRELVESELHVGADSELARAPGERRS